jgi:peptidyl-Lys metalloendopeptidase
MSRVVRNTVLATALVAATGLTFAARHASTAPLANPLSIGVFADAARTQAFMGTVQVKVTNNSNQIVQVPYWQLPGANAESKLFQVSRDGKPVDYLGKLVKRGAPTQADLVSFQPYETKVYNVNLAEAYDLGREGGYTIGFHSYLDGARTAQGRRVGDAAGRTAQLGSAPLSVYVDEKNALNALRSGGRKPPSGGGVVYQNGVGYAACSSTQISGAAAGLAQARVYTEDGKNYLNANKQGPRYTTWFGAITSTRYATAKSHFTSIDAAMDQTNNSIIIDCSCHQSYYAYVYPTQPYRIYVCNAFWSAPTSGTDSKGGTLVHEMSHFNVTAATDDHVYGQSAAKNLAITNPDQALDNADSHEYFGENTPHQN